MYLVMSAHTVICQNTQIHRYLTVMSTRRGGRMSRVPASRPGRSRNLKIVGSSPDPADSISGRVKLMTLKLILVAS